MSIKQKLISPALLWLIAAAGIFVIFQVFPNQLVFQKSAIVSFLVWLAIAFWLYLSISAASIHRQSHLSVKKIDKIVETGIYAKVRHPIYLADMLLAWAAFLFQPEIRFLFSVLWFTLVFLIWMNLEEKALSEKFGEKYLEYKKRVPKIIPRF